jgi:hypothetical protein
MGHSGIQVTIDLYGHLFPGNGRVPGAAPARAAAGASRGQLPWDRQARRLRTMPLFLLVVLAVLLAAGQTAQADTKRCRVGYYIPGADMAQPDVTKLRAINLPRRTDGYAPRCLVAEAIVGRIQDRYERTGVLPASVRVGGAAWSGGRWDCTYGDGRGTCRKRGKPRRRVTMRIG